MSYRQRNSGSMTWNDHIIVSCCCSFRPPTPLDTRDATYEKRETVSSKAEIVLNDLKELNQRVEDKEETVGSGGGLAAAYQIYGKSSSTSEGIPYGCMQLIRGQWPKNR